VPPLFHFTLRFKRWHLIFWYSSYILSGKPIANLIVQIRLVHNPKILGIAFNRFIFRNKQLEQTYLWKSIFESLDNSLGYFYHIDVIPSTTRKSYI
jgi:hypothetical protein